LYELSSHSVGPCKIVPFFSIFQEIAKAVQPGFLKSRPRQFNMYSRVDTGFRNIYKKTSLQHVLSQPRFQHLESRVGVDEELLEVSLEPATGLRGGLESIRVTAVRVVAGGGGVRGTVALATGLDPDPGIEERVGGGRAWADTETSADDIAPVSPCLLLGGLNTVAGWKRSALV
jgi:hypothetical protein